MTANYRVDVDVAIISIDNAPVNGLAHAARQGIAAGLASAQADARVRAIVLRGKGRGFCGGADIGEFGKPEAVLEPSVWTLIASIEASTKPVIAAIHGICLGGGLELALGCHYRVAANGCIAGFPEITLGLLPGAGGTQRAPRVLGVENALNMILSGERLSAEHIAAQPGQKMIDWLASSDETFETEALAFARSVAGQAGRHPLIRDLPCQHPRGASFFQFVRNSLSPAQRELPAPVACIDAVEAATRQPFDRGLEKERKLFLGLIDTPEGRALRHNFFAERAATRVQGVPATTPLREIRSVAIVGGGTMGSGIALCMLDAGLPVRLLETSQAGLDRALNAIRFHYDAQIKKGRLKAADVDQRLNVLQVTLDYDDLRTCDLAIEAVFEDLTVKQTVFEQLDKVMAPGAILASNTSTMDLNAIAGFTGRPRDVVGLHFFSPANIMRLLEVVRGKDTAPDVLATVMSLAKRIRKTAVVSGVCDGFIGNRMFEEYGRQAAFLLEEGASPQQVDKAMVAFGMAMGPFAVSDLAGNDIGWSIRRSREVARPEMIYSQVGDRLYELGRHGHKTQAGWFDYAPGQRARKESPVVQRMLEEHRKNIGIVPRAIADTEIVERLVLALVNEGARILEDGIAARASDIDLVYLTGYGFPARRGGPMQYADELGLHNVAEAMRRLHRNARIDRGFWKPAALIERLVAGNQSFN